MSFADSYGITFSEAALKNLTDHMILLIIRVREGNSIVASQLDYTADETIIQFVRSISEWMEKKFQIQLTKGEIHYLTVHILSTANVSDTTSARYKEIQGKVILILKELDHEFLTSFLNDKELVESLTLHIYPLIHRLCYNVQLENPLTDKIYSQFMNVYLIAYRFAELVSQQFNCTMNQEEISLITVHFATYFEREKIRQLEQFKRIVVINNDSLGVQHLLKTTLQTLFQKANILFVKSLDEEVVRMDAIDLILNTTNKSMNHLSAFVIDIPSVLGEKEILRLKDILSLKINTEKEDLSITKTQTLKDLFTPDLFFLERGEDYMQILRSTAEKMFQKGYASQSFPEDVIHREQAFTTIYENLVAAPHGMKMTALKDSIAIVLLDKPISHQGKQVQLIFMLNLKQGHLFLHTELGHMLLTISSQREVVRDLVRTKTYLEFMNRLTTLHII